VAREYQHLLLDKLMCEGMREAIRPLASTSYSPRLVLDFCERLYMAFYSLESDPEKETVDFPVDLEEIMVINNFLSSQDGDWAVATLHQTRQVLYELTMNKSAMKLAFSSDVEKLFPDPTPEKPPESELIEPSLDDTLDTEEVL